MRPWNIVTLGDGTTARLVPRGSLSVVVEPDGHRSCQHTDATTCYASGHETVTLYEVEIIGKPSVQMVPRANKPATLGKLGASDV